MNFNIKTNFKIAPLTWLKVGGEVDELFMPKTIEELQLFITTYPDKKITVIGAASNCLILDGGIRGTVIKTNFLNKTEVIETNVIKAECGALDSHISRFAMKNSIGGLEFLDSIPGTIGGGILTNAGCYKKEIKDILVHCTAIKRNGTIITLSKEDLKFSYRKGHLPHDVFMITDVTLKGYWDSEDNIKKTMAEFTQIRKTSQPTGISTCGCTFKNPSLEKKAWEVIKESACDELDYENVGLSKLHCNFLENKGSSGDNIAKFCEKVQEKVKEKTNISLELEMFILGEKLCTNKQ